MAPINSEIPKEYTDVVDQRSRAAAEAMEAVAKENEEIIISAKSGILPITVGEIEKRKAEELSLAECRRNYIAKYKPVVITGLGAHLTTCKEPLSLASVFEWLRRTAGNKLIGVYSKHSHLTHSYGNTPENVEVVTISELVNSIEKGTEERGRYLYDFSLPMRMPGLVSEHVRVPKYFSHDYMMRTMYPHSFSKSWPSLFIGEPGTHSSLHVDQWTGHFWMYMLAGHKRWTLFHPDDKHLLYPSWERGTLDPSFPDLREMDNNPDKYPLVRLARRVDVVLGPGDVLFVPGGSPHYVENLDVVVACAGNFIDDSNFDQAMHDIRLMGLRQGGVMADTFTAIDQVEYDPDEGMDEALHSAANLVVEYPDYASGKVFSEY